MISFKVAEDSDIQTLSSLGYSIFSQTYEKILSKEQIEYMLEMMYSPQSLKRQMEENNTFYIVSYNDAACGYIEIENHADNTFHLQRLYLHCNFRGKGIGAAMMQKVFDHAKELAPGGAEITLNVNRANPTLGFYEKSGWKIIDRGDFELGNGFYANDYIMSITV